MTNQLFFTIIVSWQTKNWLRTRQAERWCKDFGLKLLHKKFYIGKMNLKERNQLDQKMAQLLSGKNERYCSFMMCGSCSQNIFTNFVIHSPVWLDSAYEIVQDQKNP